MSSSTLLRLALISLALMAAGPLTFRAGVVRFPVALALIALGTVLAAGVVLSCVVVTLRAGPTPGVVAALALAAAAAAIPLVTVIRAGRPPSIHDITTDMDDPPAFVALLPLRGDDSSTPAYDGPAAAASQRIAYPDIVPITINAPPADAMRRVERAIGRLGWDVVAIDQDRGRLEATDTTFWFRFVDDVVIRVRGDEGGSRIDVRSKSRVGRGDLGTNANRIRMFMRELRSDD